MSCIPFIFILAVIIEAIVYQEVTPSYFPVADVVLVQPHLSIATYNRGCLNEIKPGVTEDGKTTFKDLSRGLLYFPADSLTLHFDSVSDYKLFVIYGSTPYVADMQRPFVVQGDGVVYY